MQHSKTARGTKVVEKGEGEATKKKTKTARNRKKRNKEEGTLVSYARAIPHSVPKETERKKREHTMGPVPYQPVAMSISIFISVVYNGCYGARQQYLGMLVGVAIR